MVKAGQQEAVCHIEHLFARNFFHFDRAGQQHAQIEHHLEQQVLRCAVFFHVIHQREQILLTDFIRCIVNGLHIAFVQTQASEANINRRFLIKLHF